MNDIKHNLDLVRFEIAKSAEKSGRKPEDIKLVAVTKTVDTARINEAISLGVSDIGENRVQEMTVKYCEVSPVNWHLIGHLQTNKVKYIAGKTALIHSVDSLKLAEEIDRCARNTGIVQDILIQFNMSREESKFGANPENAEKLLESIQTLGNINACGIMTIAPLYGGIDAARETFKRTKELFDKLKEKNKKFTYLSMGMTNDYPVAIEEGANIVRVGSGIFGNRILT